MASGTRSKPECWLLGKPIEFLSKVRLPRKREALSLYLFHHVEKKKTSEALKLVCEEVLTVWERAHIPTQRVDTCIKKLRRIWDEYVNLKKNRTRKRESDRIKEKMFVDELQSLFDVASCDALEKMKNEEDKNFLQMQREDVSSSSMAGVDSKTSGIEARREQRRCQAAVLKCRYEEREAQEGASAAVAFSSSSITSEDSQTDDDFRPSTSTCGPSSPAKRSKNIFKSPEVVGALDRVNLPDRGAAFVAGAVAQALGHDLSDLTLSKLHTAVAPRNTTSCGPAGKGRLPSQWPHTPALGREDVAGNGWKDGGQDRDPGDRTRLREAAGNSERWKEHWRGPGHSLPGTAGVLEDLG